MKKIATGNRVAYSREFLHRIAATREERKRRATVTKVKPLFQSKHYLCRLQWDDGRVTSALSCNLRIVKGGD